MNLLKKLPGLCLIAVLVVCLTACMTTYIDKGERFHLQLHSGQVSLALQTLEQQQVNQHDKGLFLLNKALLLRMQADYIQSNQYFEQAKILMEPLEAVSMTENVAAVTVNETLRSYVARPYERLLLHAYMALNYLALSQPDEARVEMLQADVKMREWADAEEFEGIRAAAFIRYLSGIVYEITGFDDDALIAYRKAMQTYQQDKQPIPKPLQKDLLRMTHKLDFKNEYTAYHDAGFTEPSTHIKDNSGELIVILNTGLVQRLSEQQLLTYSKKLQHMVSIALPSYPLHSLTVPAAGFALNDQWIRFAILQNINDLARQDLNAAMPGLTARALLRTVLKREAVDAIRKKSSFIGLLTDITSIITERADTRSWSTLPTSIQILRTRLPTGVHIYRLADGITVGEVNIKANKITVLSLHNLNKHKVITLH